MKRSLFNAYWLTEHFSPFKSLQKLMDSRRLEIFKSSLSNNEIAEKLDIEIIDGSEKIDYNYISSLIQHNKPFIVRGFASDWPCVQNWTPDLFDSEYGDDEIHIFDKDSYEEVSTSSLREIARGIKEGKQDYARFTSVLHQHPKLKKDFDIEKIKKLRLGKDSSSYQFFLGAKGTETPLHAASTGNLFIEIYGKKKWVMISTDYSYLVKPVVNRTPYFQSNLNISNSEFKHLPLKYREFTIEPGDLLYTPSYHWHQVENLSDSMGMAFRWINVPAALRSSPVMVLLNIFATNPSVLSSLKLKEEFTRVFSMTKYDDAKK
jgi:hypothetical protein